MPEIPEQIKGDVARFIQLIEDKSLKMPDWWTEYARQLAYNLQVHTKGLMFDKVTGLYPNENPESQRHCINSYEPITKGAMWKGIDNIIRVFNNSSYKFQVSEKTKKVLASYEDEEGSLFSQFFEDWIRFAIATDANGICVTYPLEYTEDLYRYVSHSDILWKDNDVLIFVSEIESERKYEFTASKYDSKEFFVDYEYVPTGQPNYRHVTVRTFNRRLETKYLNRVYHVFTRENFYKIYKEKPDDKDWQFEFYAHPKQLETLPYFDNGGEEIEPGLYESFVQRFVPFGNKALIADRNLRAVDLMFSYPRMAEVQQKCDECGGDGKKVYDLTTNLWEECRTCHGSKYVVPQSPYRVYRKVNDTFDADGKVFSTPSVEFYTPDVAILQYATEQPDKYIEKAEAAIFVSQKIPTGNVESAKSKEIDLEDKYAWLSKIKKVLFNNLQMFLQYLENYVNPSPIQVSVEQPYSLAILTEEEAFEALSKILGSSAPIAFKANQIDNFINKFVSESSPVKRALYILKKFDLLLYYSTTEVNNMKGQGIVSAKMVQQHVLAYPVLMQLYELNPTLFELEDEAIIKRLAAEIDRYDLTQDLKTAITKNGNGIPA